MAVSEMAHYTLTSKLDWLSANLFSCPNSKIQFDSHFEGTGNIPQCTVKSSDQLWSLETWIQTTMLCDQHFPFYFTQIFFHSLFKLMRNDDVVQGQFQLKNHSSATYKYVSDEHSYIKLQLVTFR